MSTKFAAFVGVAPGLEVPLLEELRELGAKPKQTGGGATCWLDAEGLWRVAHYARVAELLRVRLGQFEARNWSGLEKGLSKLPWRAYLKHGSAPRIRVSCKKSKLYHTSAIAERAAKIIGGAVSGPTGRDEAGNGPPCPDVHLRLGHDLCTVRVDAGGDMHKRGWRENQVAAPLRETLAAAVVRLSGWTPDAPLVDPFCGSGTIPLEALARALKPPSLAAPPLTTWASHSLRAYRDWSVDAGPLGKQATGTIWAGDNSPRAVQLATDNAELAGYGLVTTVLSDAAQMIKRAPEGAYVVSNPPYGKRIGAGELAKTTSALGAALRGRPDICATFITGWHGFQNASGIRWKTLAKTSNRGLPVVVLQRPAS